MLCSAFIRVENIENERATCPVCAEVTCTMCKAEAHTGDCPADTALQLVLDTANENGWQRCYGCRRLVELDIGCNHITYVSLIPNSSVNTDLNRCPCGSQFCYVCARRWTTCQCAQWNEDRLLARANQVVARQPVKAEELIYRNNMRGLRLWRKISERGITVTMSKGDMFEARLNVRSPIIHCLLTFLSVSNVISRLVIGVGGIDCRVHTVDHWGFCRNIWYVFLRTPMNPTEFAFE